jgi:hypothetical protein
MWRPGWSVLEGAESGVCDVGVAVVETLLGRQGPGMLEFTALTHCWVWDIGAWDTVVVAFGRLEKLKRDMDIGNGRDGFASADVRAALLRRAAMWVRRILSCAVLVWLG